MDVIRLIASDLDATLLDDQSQLPPDFAETVRALAERGIRFAAASGRPIYTLEEMFATLRDHIILAENDYFSMRESNRLPFYDFETGAMLRPYGRE